MELYIVWYLLGRTHPSFGIPNHLSPYMYRDIWRDAYEQFLDQLEYHGRTRA